MSPNKLLDAYVECRNQIEEYSDYRYASICNARRKLARKIEIKLQWLIYDLDQLSKKK